MEPDAYFSNLHKWAYAPKNVSFLYVSDKYLNVKYRKICRLYDLQLLVILEVKDLKDSFFGLELEI